ncbi:CIC11C00000002867 [Sungouiella intermedia]|uniref:DNA-directed RNA polymerase III subunit RPC9 n=1 Tax=Sungouiella intermedia TaxID=45354 RepID=A0A1L0BME0_9ASCO|nr:CIC11C00000002867 [[Candida] intermedia]
MKILAERSAFLLDYEVLQHLEELKVKYNWTFTPEDETKQKNRKKRFTAAGLGLEVATRDITLYLSKNAASKYPNSESFTALMTFLNQFELMKVEKLQIVNSLPRSMVHLYGLVEECDLRFDENTCESILAKINELVPLDEADDDVDDAEEEEEE